MVYEELCESINYRWYNKFYLPEGSKDKKWQENCQEMRQKRVTAVTSTEAANGSWSRSTSADDEGALKGFQDKHALLGLHLRKVTPAAESGRWAGKAGRRGCGRELPAVPSTDCMASLFPYPLCGPTDKRHKARYLAHQPCGWACDQSSQRSPSSCCQMASASSPQAGRMRLKP